MRVRAGVMVWAISVVGCRDQNPYFVEPPLATSSGASDSESGTGTGVVTGVVPTTRGTTGTSDGEGTASGDTGTTMTTGSTATTDSVCVVGAIVCEGTSKRVCDGNGGFVDEEACPALCVADVGCALCVPQSTRCEGDVAQVCDGAGMAWGDVETCDPLQGLSCDADVGSCTGMCTDAALGRRQVGCDFYGASLGNLHAAPWTEQFGMIAVNISTNAAVVTVTRGDVMVKQVTVPVAGMAKIELDYVPEVSQSGTMGGASSVLVADGAFRLRSTQPVTMYQYEPFDPSASGEASLLLPVHMWGDDHVVASRAFKFGAEQEFLGGFYAVVASEDATQVVVTPPPGGTSTAQGAGIDEGGNGVVVLDAGGVLEVFAANGGDPTGARVTSNKPVGVFGGHRCAAVPDFLSSCNHLEESMPPVATLGKEYFISPPHAAYIDEQRQAVRIIATEADTSLVFTPAQEGVSFLELAGEWFEMLPNPTSFRISADKKVLVAQYMTSGDPFSDPSMAVALPTAQYQNAYLVAASSSYDSRWVSVVAPDGAALKVNGVTIADLVPIPGTGFSAASAALPLNAPGINLVAGDQPFSAMVHGYAPLTSFWYAGGMALETLPP